VSTSKRLAPTLAPASGQHQGDAQLNQGLTQKIGQRQHQGAAAFGQAAPTARAALERVAEKLRMGGAKLPMTVTAEPSTPESLMASGLSTALCLVEVELEALVAAAPRENAAHSALFCLPPIQHSSETAVVVQAMPAQKVVTGDAEVDAVLWLREVISTGQADLIEKARQAAAKIKTPLIVLKNRYTEYLRRTCPSNLMAGLAAMGFDDLNNLARASTERATQRQEAYARFGDALFDETPAERFCNQVLDGVPRDDDGWQLKASQVDVRFDSYLPQRPGTLTQCVLELLYWNDLYWLRCAVDRDRNEPGMRVNARQDYVFRCMARIPPRDADEAVTVLHYLQSNDGMDRGETGSVLMNLIGAPEPYHVKKGGGDE